MVSLALVTLHLLAAVVWIGGMLFVGLVLTPVLRGRPPVERATLLHVVGRRFLKVGWTALAILLVTGPAMWALLNFKLTPVLIAKLILVAVILLLSLFHDFSLGPRLVAQMQKGGEGNETFRLRRRVALLARLNILCAIVVLILGLAFSRGL
ncbi:MAG: DUF4149 domain-containing protein [Candidatus Methylomirabilales bacterium]